jgi:hypothetical protein
MAHGGVWMLRRKWVGYQEDTGSQVATELEQERVEWPKEGVDSAE